ncbi:protein LAZ1-like [Olea europaea var. sylvestris]|uniref:protein LAZ1-like n=1 Tax=Olea europaea var. sylvestris TaxID=158386 RepID=UPI000C1D83DB|nr:protein LAZ1-like [Olea europaea var. sylvestris]
MLQNIINSDYLNWIGSSYSPPSWAALIAGFFVILTLTLSVYLLFEHLSAYKNPEEQKFLIGVVLMVPCYAVESFVSLVNPAISVDIEILRDCYESFAMYCFGRYLVACLGGEERTIAFMKREGRISAKMPLLDHGSERGIVKHPFPMNLILKPWKMGQWVYQVIKFGIVQYMIIKAVTAILAVILEVFGVYCEGDFKWNCGYCVDVLWFHVGELSPMQNNSLIDFCIAPGHMIDSADQLFVTWIVNDLKFTVTQAVEPVEKGINKFNQKLHKISQNIKRHDKGRRTKDDSCIATTSPTRRVIRGIDDPLLNGSISDSGSSRRKKHRRKSGYTSAESGGESSSGDQTFGGYQIHGRRWVIKD